MADRVLRDHSQPCEHGHLMSSGHWESINDPMCPGGREVTDSEILTMAADIIETNPSVGAVFDTAASILNDEETPTLEGWTRIPLSDGRYLILDLRDVGTVENDWYWRADG